MVTFFEFILCILWAIVAGWLFLHLVAVPDGVLLSEGQSIYKVYWLAFELVWCTMGIWCYRKLKRKYWGAFSS